MVFEILRLNKKFQSNCISGAIAQLIECLGGEQEDPASIPRKGHFFLLNLFLRGSIPNGEQQGQEQQQLK